METWYLRTAEDTFGPESREKLIEWARRGRIQPGQEVSDDNEIWQRVESVPFLDMRFSIDIGDGNPRGPFNKAAADALLASGRLPPIAKIVEVREPFEDPKDEREMPEEAPEEAPKEERFDDAKVIVKEVPVEKVIEKIVVKEVPVEKVVEKVVEKIKEVPVEVEKIVVDERRVKELEKILADSNARAAKLNEQVVALEDELKRIPQAASDVADMQAAVFQIMREEENDLAAAIEREKSDFEELRKCHDARLDKLVERRRELLRHSGANPEDMTRKALVERPEDPRVTRLRHELDELKLIHEQSMLDDRQRIQKLEEELRLAHAEEQRRRESEKDVTQLLNENQRLREALQRTEKDLVAERQQCEAMRQREAASKQTLMARIASLESPSIGTAATVETNQSREAKMVKLASWMKLKG